MKHSSKIIYLFLLLLISCSSKKVERIFVSQDDKVTLTVTSVQKVAFDPYLTNVNVKGYGHDENLPFEVYSNSLNQEDIKMHWTSNSEGILTIKEGDGNIRKLRLSISRTRVQLKE